jgi:hypothetical protein
LPWMYRVKITINEEVIDVFDITCGCDSRHIGQSMIQGLGSFSDNSY